MRALICGADIAGLSLARYWTRWAGTWSFSSASDRIAMPRMTTLALAPIAVRFPPKLPQSQATTLKNPGAGSDLFEDRKICGNLRCGQAVSHPVRRHRCGRSELDGGLGISTTAGWPS
jgi:hypothetical protein